MRFVREWLAAYDHDPDVFASKYANLTEKSKAIIDALRSTEGYEPPTQDILAVGEESDYVHRNKAGISFSTEIIPNTDEDAWNSFVDSTPLEAQFGYVPEVVQFIADYRDNKITTLPELNAAFNSLFFSAEYPSDASMLTKDWVNEHWLQKNALHITDKLEQEHRYNFLRILNAASPDGMAYKSSDPAIADLYALWREWESRMSDNMERITTEYSSGLTRDERTAQREEVLNSFSDDAFAEVISASIIPGVGTLYQTGRDKSFYEGTSYEDTAISVDDRSKNTTLQNAFVDHIKPNKLGWFGEDDDEDGFDNTVDAYPNNINYWDEESKQEYDFDHADTDGDGRINKIDLDIYNKDVWDEESQAAYQLTITDSDGDNVPDASDDYPNNKNFWDEGSKQDYEYSQLDSDNDSYINAVDDYPNNKNYWDAGSKQEYEYGLLDDDDDKVINAEDDYPNNKNYWDAESKQEYDYGQEDTDNDSYINAVDEFPLDPSEHTDVDKDGFGSNVDFDDNDPNLSEEYDTLEYAALDVNQDGIVDALTDGLLVMRYLFGLETGQPLFSGGLRTSGSARSEEEIIAFLEKLKDGTTKQENPGLFNVFDLDQNGQLDPLTDGLLMLRAAFGTFSPEGAIADDSPFTTMDTEVATDLITARFSAHNGKNDEGIKIADDGRLVIPSEEDTKYREIYEELFSDYAVTANPDAAAEMGEPPQKVNLDNYFLNAAENAYEAYKRDGISSIDLAGMVNYIVDLPESLWSYVFDISNQGLINKFDATGDGKITSEDAAAFHSEDFGVQVPARENELAGIKDKLNNLFIDDQETVYEAYIRGVDVEELSSVVLEISVLEIKGEDLPLLGMPADYEAFVDRFDSLGSGAISSRDAQEIKAENFGWIKERYLSEYDGRDEIPKGAGEEQIRKRFEILAEGIVHARHYTDFTDPEDVAEFNEITAPAIAELEKAKNENPEAYAIVAADYNKDGGDAGVLDLDFFDVNPDVAGVTTAEESVAYDTEQAEIAARQQALDNYTGEGALPEGSGEIQVRKRFEYWRDNAPATAEAEENRKTEAAQIAADYSTAFNVVKADFDTDEDGVIDLLDVSPDDPGITTSQELEDSKAVKDESAEVGTIGFGKLPTKQGRDRTSYRSDMINALRDEDGKIEFFNNGLTGGDTYYQGYVIPLTTEELIDGYYSILNTGTWVDPRTENQNGVNDFLAGNIDDINQYGVPVVDVAKYGKESEDNNTYNGKNVAGAQAFLDEYTKGTFVYEGQMGGPLQEVDINYGIDDSGDFITLSDLFNRRVPLYDTTDLQRVDRENILPAGFIQGVDRLPDTEELYGFYTDAIIYASAIHPDLQLAYDYADKLMANLPAELYNEWKKHPLATRWDQDPANISTLKRAIKPSDLIGLDHYTEIDTSILRDYAENMDVSEVTGKGKPYQDFLNTVADAIDKFVEDPSSLSPKEKEYLNQYRVVQNDILFMGTQDLENDTFDIEDTALSEISRVADYQTIQDNWANRETLFGSQIADRVEENYDYQYGGWSPDPNDPNDRPPEYGFSMSGQGLEWSNGQAFFGGTGFTVPLNSVVVWDEDNMGKARIRHGAYIQEWQNTMNSMDLPSYQETNILGVGLETSERFTELTQKDNRNAQEEAEYQELVEALSSNTMSIFGDDLPPVWYDATRLYMKHPYHDYEASVASGYANQADIDFSINRQVTNRGYGAGSTIGDLGGVGKMDYTAFANPGGENEGRGFYLDISGGTAPIGSYSMVWVSQPEWYEPPEQSFWEFILTNPVTSIMVSIIAPGYGNAILAGLKAASGITLHASDWLSLGLGALKLTGNLQMPVDATQAEQMAQADAVAAVDAAEAAGQTLTELERATLMLETYNGAYSVYVTGFGIAGMSAAQTVDLMKIVAYEGNIGSMLVSSFGDEYFTKGLSIAGIDVSNLPDFVVGLMNDVATEMLDGKSFDDAISIASGTELLGYLETEIESSKVYGTAKNILEEFKNDLNQATQAVQTMADDAVEGVKETITAISESMDTDLLEDLSKLSSDVRTDINQISQTIGNIATELNAEVLAPVSNAIKNNMGKFMTMAGLDNENLFSVSGDSVADADNLMGDIKDLVGDTIFESVPDAIKDTLREAAIQKISLGEVDENEMKLMATRGSITVKAVSNLDGDLVDAIGPRILTKALQNTLTAATFGGDPGEAFLDTIVDSTIQSIEAARASGGWDEVVKQFDQFEDRITGKSREAQTAADEYNKIGTDFNALETRKKALEKENSEYLVELDRLELAAMADGAGDLEMQAYINYAEFYTNRAQGIGEELSQIKEDKDALIAALPAAETKYDNAVAAINAETATLDPLLQKQYDDLYVNALLAVHPEIKMGEYAVVSGMEWEGEYPTAEEIAEHYLSYGIQNGVPVNVEEYNARRDAGASQYVLTALREAGIDATKLTPEEIKNTTNYLLNEHATAKAEENGQTVVEYLENFNETPDNAEKALEAAYVLEEGFGTPPDAVALTVANRRASYAFNALGMSAEDVNNIANNEVSYTIDPDTGDIMWGGDGYMMREWNSSTNQFDTYQYDAGGGLRYRLNDDGSEPLIRELERTEMFNGIADLAEDSPASYMTFLATAPTDAAINAQVNYLTQKDPYSDELQEIKNIQAAIKAAPEDDGRFAIPDSELPWEVRVARDWLEHSQEIENALRAEVEALENLEGPLSVDEELRLEFARDAYSDAEGSTEFLANWVVKTPTKINAFVQTSLNAFTAWSQGIAAEKKADGFRRQALFEGKSAEEADAIFREKYAEFKQDIDYSSIVHNEANQTHNMMESLARGYLPDSYLADQKEMGENIAAADGTIDTVIAITGEIIDKPDVFLGTYLADELPTAIFGLGIGSAAGRITSLAAAKVVGKEAAESLAAGSTVSMGATRVADYAEAFGESAYGTYEDTKAELERIGYEGDIEAKAQEIAIRVGTAAMVMVGATEPFGAFALDNAILNASTKKAVKEVAQRVEGLGNTLTKETVTEVIQGGFTQGATEVFLYNAGVTDRDYAANIAGSAYLEGLVGGTTAGVMTGLSTPTDTGTGFGGGDPFANLVFSNPDIKEAIELGDATQVQALLGERNLTGTPIYVEVMNTVDDANFVTPSEARQAFNYLGVDPDGDEVVALLDREGVTDATLEAEAEAYWSETYGQEQLGTGRTTAQHYDIIQHMANMINGDVPLDSTFNMNGDTTLNQADIDEYIAKLPPREQDLYNQYDPAAHVPTGIIEEMGGSLMTSQELAQLKQDIQTILDRGDPVTAQEVVDMLLLDPTNKALLKGQIEAAVGNEFAKLENQQAFASEVVNKLVENKTIETKSKEAVKELFGDPNGNTEEEQGVFGIIEGLKDMLDLGESDATTLADYITEKIGTAVELDADGKIKEGTGSGLLGTLTRNGILRDVAIAELATVLGSEEDGTGLYGIAADATSAADAVARIETQYGTLDTEYAALKNLYDTAVASMQTNLGSPGVADDPDTEINEYKSATGLYALVGKAIAAGDSAEAAVSGLLGEYVDFAAFESALELTMKGKVDEVVTAFGTPPVYETNDDGTIKRNEAGEPIIKDAATGLLGDMYAAMQLQGADRDLAIAALKSDIDAALTQVEQVSSTATAAAIKDDILNEYFPAKPDDYTVGRDLAQQLDYIQSLMRTGQFDADYDTAGDVGTITQEDYDAALTAINENSEQQEALANYNAWLATPNAITPALENLSRETGANFDLLNRRVTAVETNVNDYVRDNVVSMIGQPEVTEEEATALNPKQDATGLYALVQEGDQDILDVLGELGTIEDGVLTGGNGLLRDMQLLGMSNAEIKSFLDTNLGTPAEGDQGATGLYAAVGANTEALNTLEETVNSITIPEVDLTGLATTEDVTEATQDLVTDTELTQAIEGIQFPETDLTGLATTEDVTQAVEGIQFPEVDLSGLATSADVQMLADLIGKPVNLLTDSDIELATAYLAAVQTEQEVAQQDVLRYDVTGDQLLTQEDIDLMAGTLETGDYTGFADTSPFTDTATGMFGREQQLQETIVARDQELEAQRQEQVQRDQDLRTQIQTDFETARVQREEQEKQEKLFESLQAPGRTVTTKPADPYRIDEIYDFESIFRGGDQEAFYSSASPYGDNFLTEILNPQQRRAKGGMVEDKTDEILRIIGDK